MDATAAMKALKQNDHWKAGEALSVTLVAVSEDAEKLPENLHINVGELVLAMPASSSRPVTAAPIRGHD